MSIIYIMYILSIPKLSTMCAMCLCHSSLKHHDDYRATTFSTKNRRVVVVAPIANIATSLKDHGNTYRLSKY